MHVKFSTYAIAFFCFALMPWNVMFSLKQTSENYKVPCNLVKNIIDWKKWKQMIVAKKNNEANFGNVIYCNNSSIWCGFIIDTQNIKYSWPIFL